MLRLLRQKLDALADPLDPGFGFDLIRLEALLAEETKPATISFDSDENARRQVRFLTDRLSVKFGEHRVQRFVPQDTHIPEAAGAAVPAQDDEFAGQGWLLKRRPGDPPRRPLRLLERPEEVSAMASIPDGPPVRFRWRQCLHEVARAEGPERIAMEWWHKARADPRLFPRRNQRWPTFLVVSRRALSPDQNDAALVSARPVRMSYAELAVTTNFSFLRGASHPQEFVEQAAKLGHAAIGIADRNSLAGVVRAYEQWKKLAGSAQASGRGAAGVSRRHAGHPGLSRKPQSLWLAVPSFVHRQAQGGKRRMPAGFTRPASNTGAACC